MPWCWPWYRKRQESDRPHGRHPLREFVYLDEVSVYSLLASRSGPVPTDFTDTETASLKDEVSSGASLGVSGAKAELRTRMESATGTSSQIVRKSSAQARFKQFLEAEENGFLFSVSPVVSGDAPPPTLRRGELFEMSVELDAHETFRISQTIASILEILNQDGVQLLANVDPVEMKKVLAFNRILERLLVGLVPIRAKAVDYVVLLQEGTAPQVVARSVLPDISIQEESIGVEPLYVVGFAQRDLFWKDPRTVLFGQHRFTLTGRLTSESVQDRWSPVKLTEVLRPFMPEVADDLELAGHHFATSFQASATGAGEVAQTERLHEALSDYVGRLTTDEGAANDVRQTLIERIDGFGAMLDGNLEQTRAVFDEVTDMLRQRVGDESVDGTEIATHRSSVISTYGLPPGLAPDDPPVEAPTDSGIDEWSLEAEVIALYW